MVFVNIKDTGVCNGEGFSPSGIHQCQKYFLLSYSKASFGIHTGIFLVFSPFEQFFIECHDFGYRSHVPDIHKPHFCGHQKSHKK